MDYLAERLKKQEGHREVWEIYRRHAVYELCLDSLEDTMAIGSALGRARENIRNTKY